MTRFAELCALSNFSFLRGASHPHEMVQAAARLGLDALVIADRNTLAGAVRTFLAAKDHDLRALVGCRLVTAEGVELACVPRTRTAWAWATRIARIWPTTTAPAWDSQITRTVSGVLKKPVVT